MDVAMLNRTRMAATTALLCAIWLGGCARWSTVPDTSEPMNLLPRPKLATDSVVFEVTFVQIPEDRDDFSDRFWAEVDESTLPNDLRRHLAANGMRCGLVGTSVPAALQEVLELQPDPAQSEGTQVTDPSRQVVVRTHRLASRAGQLGKIIVRAMPEEKMATLSFDRDGQLSGQTLTKAQCRYSITSFPQGDGDVRVELMPLIEHGALKPRIRGENGMWMVDNTSRETRVFEDLKVTTNLAPGEALAVSCTEDPRGLGHQFFGDHSQERHTRQLLLVRLQQTQRDDRFLAPLDQSDSLLDQPAPLDQSESLELKFDQGMPVGFPPAGNAGG